MLCAIAYITVDIALLNEMHTLTIDMQAWYYIFWQKLIHDFSLIEAVRKGRLNHVDSRWSWIHIDTMFSLLDDCSYEPEITIPQRQLRARTWTQDPLKQRHVNLGSPPRSPRPSSFISLLRLSGDSLWLLYVLKWKPFGGYRMKAKQPIIHTTGPFTRKNWKKKCRLSRLTRCLQNIKELYTEKEGHCRYTLVVLAKYSSRLKLKYFNHARAIHSLEGKMYSQLPDPILSAVGGASLACTMSAKVQWPEAEVRC